ncbi:MAG: Tsi3 family protein [Methylobacterium frigidaeris]
MPRAAGSRALAALGACTLAVLGACDRDAPQPAARIATAEVAGTVLSVAVPSGRRAVAIPAGLVLGLEKAGARRRIDAMTLELGRDAAGVSFDQVRGTGAAAIRYGVVRSPGGSGGDEVTLVAERRCADAIVTLHFATQVEEPEAPDLEAAFAVLAGARCSSGR